GRHRLRPLHAHGGVLFMVGSISCFLLTGDLHALARIATVACRSGPHRPGVWPPRETAPETELAAQVDAVRQKPVPEDVADCSGAIELENRSPDMAEVVAHSLLKTQLVAIRDVECQGRCRHQSDEEFTNATHLVFPYRGIYVRHLGTEEAVAEANQVLFF